MVSLIINTKQAMQLVRSHNKHINHSISFCVFYKMAILLSAVYREHKVPAFLDRVWFNLLLLQMY